MPKDKKPRRRRSTPTAAAPQASDAAEVLPAPRNPAPVPTHRNAEPAPVVARLTSVILTVAGALIDIADAAAEALTRRLEGRA